MALLWLWADTNQLSLISHRRFTYFPFLYFLRLWEQDGEGRVERTYRPTSVFRKQNKNSLSNPFSNVLLWGFMAIFPVAECGCASQ